MFRVKVNTLKRQIKEKVEGSKRMIVNLNRRKDSIKTIDVRTANGLMKKNSCF